MVGHEDGYEKAGAVLDELGGPMMPLPRGRAARAWAVVRHGKLTRVEVRVYNQGGRAEGKGRAGEAR